MRKFAVLIAAVWLLSIWSVPKADAAVSYTISPGSKTYNKQMMKYSTYNTNTKHYYLIRSYLEQLEKKGGGTLVLNKGTYTISNVLYVPSNVTIKLKDGVKLVKGTKTGTNKFAPSKSMFQLIRPSRSAKSGVYGSYKGEKNISFIGEGNAVIDLKYFQDSIAIIMGHNQNVKVDNIHFQHMKSGHFIEMDASQNVTVTNNFFTDSQASAKNNKEAINLDTPDKTTNGWSSKWSKFDKTANMNVTIEGNTFQNLERSIGTHKYSGGKYHENVVIRGNDIIGMKLDAIRVMNWANPVIEENYIENVGEGNPSLRGILASGAIHPMFRYNTFENVGRAMQFLVWKNTGPGEQYEITYNDLTDEEMAALSENNIVNTSETFIRINTVYNQFTPADTLRIELIGF